MGVCIQAQRFTPREMGCLSKNRNKKQARTTLKRSLKACERCPHCKKVVPDLDEHIRCEHSFSCARCGKRFAGELQWKQHMKDLHGLSGADAVKDDRNKKLERWLQNSKDGATQKQSVEMDDTPSAMQSVEEVDPTPAPSHRLLCESCGTEAFLPVDLAAQGLTFQCSMIG